MALCHASLKLSEFRIGGEEKPSLMPAIPRGTSATDPGLPFSWLITVVPLLQMCGLFYICRHSGQGSLSVVLLFFRVACVRSNPKLPFSQPPNQKKKTKNKTQTMPLKKKKTKLLFVLWNFLYLMGIPKVRGCVYIICLCLFIFDGL